MPISIDQTYKEAAENTEWRSAFICTEMLAEGEVGFITCPPPLEYFIYESYKYNLDVLLKYPNSDPLYVMVVDALNKYVHDWEQDM